MASDLTLRAYRIQKMERRNVLRELNACTFKTYLLEPWIPFRLIRKYYRLLDGEYFLKKCVNRSKNPHIRTK